jgi:inner membrane protein
MPSYKEHVLFSLIMVFPFFPDVFYMALAVIGASIIDMDHRVNNKNMIILGLLGVVLALVLYILKMPYLIGILIALMALLFYFSEHRGFMHSIFGIIFITGCISLFVFGAYILLSDFSTGLKISLIVTALILGTVILNRKLVPIFGFLLILGISLTPHPGFNIYYVFLSLFLGCLSHIVLDLFTPSGVQLLNPLSSGKFKKQAGFTLMGIWAGFVIASVVIYGNNFWYPILNRCYYPLMF